MTDDPAVPIRAQLGLRNGKLHVGVHSGTFPGKEVTFKISWVSENSTDTTLNHVSGPWTITTPTELTLYATKEEPPTEDTDYATKYVLSWTHPAYTDTDEHETEIPEHEYYDYYNRTNGTQTYSSDEDLKTTLYNFLLIPGVENVKSSAGNWNPGSPAKSWSSEITNVPKGTVIFFKPVKPFKAEDSWAGSVDALFTTTGGTYSGNKYRAEVKNSSEILFTHDPVTRFWVTLKKSTRTKGEFIKNIGLNCGGTNGDISSIMNMAASTIKFPGQSSKTFTTHFGAAPGLWKKHDDGAGFPTIGYGHKIKVGEDFSAGITDAQAKELLVADISDHLGEAKENMGGCWDNLDFWAKVAYTELVYNMGQNGAKNTFPNFKASLVAKTYGDPGNLNDEAALPGAGSGISFREFKRTRDLKPGETTAYPVPNQPNKAYLGERHKHIVKHILIKMSAFKPDSTTNAQNLDSSSLMDECVIDDYEEYDSPGETGTVCAEGGEDCPQLSELNGSIVGDIPVEEVCVYDVVLSHNDEDVSTFEIAMKKEGKCKCPSRIFNEVVFEKSMGYGCPLGWIDMQFKTDEETLVHSEAGLTEDSYTYRISKKD